MSLSKNYDISPSMWLNILMNSQKKKCKQSLLKLQSDLRKLDFQLLEHRQEAAEIRVRIADLLIYFGRYDRAACLAMRGLKGLQRYGGLDTLKARALNCLGIVRWYSDGPSGAIDYFRESQTIISENTEAPHAQRIEAESNLALALHETGHLQEAIEHQKTALTLAANEGKKGTIDLNTRRLANLFQDSGYFDLAQSLLMSIEPSQDATAADQVAWLNAAALLAEKRGNNEKAKHFYQRALKLFQTMTLSRASMASLLSNAATLFIDLGLADEAYSILENYEQLVPEGGTLNARLGLVRLRARLALEEKDFERAEQFWQQATRLIETDGGANSKKLADILTARSRLLWDLGQQKDALEHLQAFSHKAIDEQEEYHLEPAICLGQFLLDLERIAEAYPILLTAFQIESGIHEPDEEWRLLSALADLAFKQDQYLSAIFLGKLAVRSICQLTRPFDGSERERAAFLKSRLKPFENLIDRLISGVRFPEATHILALVKSDQIFEFVRRDAGLAQRIKTPPFRYDEQEVVREYDENRNNASYLRTTAADWRKPKQIRNGAKTELRRTGCKATKLLERLLSERWVAKQEAISIGTETRGVKEHVARLNFFTTRGSIVAHVRTLYEEKQFIISQDPAEISRLVFQLRNAIEKHSRDCQTLAERLYRILILPAGDILTGINRLEIMASGALSCLPFACLRSNNRYLIEDFVLVYQTGIKLPLSDVQRNQNKSVAAFGAIHADDHSAPLSHVNAELAAIKEACPDARIYVDNCFTIENLTKALSERISLLHIASHFHLIPAASHHSNLLLGDGTFLSLAELRSEKFDFSDLELLVLSGCDTATTEHGLNGVESLAGLAHLKGARDVIGTLWPVADIGAAAMMQHFYEAFFDQDENMDPAECLHYAQRALISKGGAGLENDMTTRGFTKADNPASFSHPFFWAGFSVFAPSR